MSNAYSFSTTTMVARMLSNVNIICTLHVLVTLWVRASSEQHKSQRYRIILFLIKLTNWWLHTLFKHNGRKRNSQNSSLGKAHGGNKTELKSKGSNREMDFIFTVCKQIWCYEHTTNAVGPLYLQIKRLPERKAYSALQRGCTLSFDTRW